VGEYRKAEHLLIAGVHRKELPLVAAGDDIGGDQLPPFSEGAGCPHQGNRGWIENGFKTYDQRVLWFFHGASFLSDSFISVSGNGVLPSGIGGTTRATPLLCPQGDMV